MSDFLSFFGIIIVWVGVSLALWAAHRLSARSTQRKQSELAGQASAKVREAQAVFDAIRSARPESMAERMAPQPAFSAAEGPPDPIRRGANAVLKHIQEKGDFFGQVNALVPQIRSVLMRADCPPLAEILHMRRDLWAAADIILVDDLQGLGETFAEPGAYERFCSEARMLLFKGEAEAAGEEDLIDLRLSLARGEAERFVDSIEEEIRLAQEKERLPSVAEIISYPVAAIQAIPGQVRAFRTYLQDTYQYILSVAQSINQSEALARGLHEFRRAREELPERFSASLEKASSLARQSAQDLRRHYDFLAAAHELRAKYEDLLHKAPELSEKGKQFIARLDLAAKSEQLRIKSQGAVEELKRRLVRLIAHMIVRLQKLQARLAVPEAAAAGQNAQAVHAVEAAANSAQAGSAAYAARSSAAGAGAPQPVRGRAAAGLAPSSARKTVQPEATIMRFPVSPAKSAGLEQTHALAPRPEEAKPLRGLEADKREAAQENSSPLRPATLGRLRSLFSARRPPSLPGAPAPRLPPAAAAPGGKTVVRLKSLSVAKTGPASGGSASQGRKSAAPAQAKGSPPERRRTSLVKKLSELPDPLDEDKWDEPLREGSGSTLSPQPGADNSTPSKNGSKADKDLRRFRFFRRKDT